MVKELTKAKATAILDAARERFAHYGEEKVTMDEIAADVGMGKATLYYYFPGKEDLHRAVIAREQAQFLDRLRKIVTSDNTPDEKLRSYVRYRVHYFKGIVNLNALSEQSPLIAMRPLLHEQYQKFLNEERILLSRIIQEGNERKLYDVEHPDCVTELLQHALHGLRLRTVQLAYKMKQNALDYKELEREMLLLVDLIIKGMVKR